MAFVRQNVVTLLLIALALGVLAVIVSLLSATTRRPVRLVEETVTVTPVTTDAGPAVAVMATIAPAPAVLPDTFAENARAVSTATQQEVDELTERVGILEDGLESTSRLVLLQFEREHGLLPLQVFPSQKQIDALEVGRTIVLSFEKDGHHYNLWLTKESNFLHLRGLVGRTDVVLANATSLERHIVRVFKAQGKASIEKAFLPVTAVSAQAA